MSPCSRLPAPCARRCDRLLLSRDRVEPARNPEFDAPADPLPSSSSSRRSARAEGEAFRACPSHLRPPVASRFGIAPASHVLVEQLPVGAIEAEEDDGPSLPSRPCDRVHRRSLRTTCWRRNCRVRATCGGCCGGCSIVEHADAVSSATMQRSKRRSRRAHRRPGSHGHRESQHATTTITKKEGQPERLASRRRAKRRGSRTRTGRRSGCFAAA